MFLRDACRCVQGGASGAAGGRGRGRGGGTGIFANDNDDELDAALASPEVDAMLSQGRSSQRALNAVRRRYP